MSDCFPTGTIIARLIRLAGTVQGLGVRPTIARLAESFSLRGFVRNTLDGVEIHAEGSRSDLDRFIAVLYSSLPRRTDVLDCSEQAAAVMDVTGFRIDSESGDGPVAVHVPVDRMICADCLHELSQPSDRRYQYGLITCTCCGPRYSLIDSLPHERVRTSLLDFDLCESCRREFETLQDRRCHAETIACPKCGPEVRFIPSNASAVRTSSSSGQSAIETAASIVRTGGIVLIKGIGGYQFVCDAACHSAIARLRQIKNRFRKPLAVMVSRRFLSEQSQVDAAIFDALLSDSNPIVVSEQFRLPGATRTLVSDCSTSGVFLPTSALHELLVQACSGPLVVTSANLEGEPLEFEDTAANERLGKLVDGILLHNRRILRPMDDSVVRMIAGRAVPLRMARGLTPLPVPELNHDPTDAHLPSILAVGANQKIAVVLGNGRQVVLGPHIGDMQTLAARERFTSVVESLCSLYRCSPEIVVCDLHPDYFTTRWAEDSFAKVVRVQHHHAHVAAGMVDHGLIDKTVLGVAFDGTGYGSDGTVWGGEFLVASLRGFERVGTLRSFPLPGGDRAIREVWRVTGGLLRAAFPDWSADQTSDWLRMHLDLNGPVMTEVLHDLVLQHSVQTSSMGRLFDGVACLVTKLAIADYEGELASRLESLCDESVTERYSFPVSRDERGLFVCDWRPMIREIIQDLECRTDVGIVAMRFHRSVAYCVRELALLSKQELVVLSGGCFQNRILTECVIEFSRHEPFRLFTPHRFPPNDGGLAIGQYAVALHLNTPQETQKGGGGRGATRGTRGTGRGGG